jgi:hypothetical protein
MYSCYVLIVYVYINNLFLVLESFCVMKLCWVHNLWIMRMMCGFVKDDNFNEEDTYI